MTQLPITRRRITQFQSWKVRDWLKANIDTIKGSPPPEVARLVGEAVGFEVAPKTALRIATEERIPLGHPRKLHGEHPGQQELPMGISAEAAQMFNEVNARITALEDFITSQNYRT